MQRIVYLTHPEVEIDPLVPVPDWGLNSIGADRVAQVVPRFAGANWDVATSAERKALETAWPFGRALGRAVHVVPDLHENDRSATGFLAGPAFEAAADQFFAAPDQSFRGWETARAAQARVVAQFDRLIAALEADQSLLICGHGGVGTLLFCHLSGHAISRQWDQKGGGHWFEIDTETRRPSCHWQPIETLQP